MKKLLILIAFLTGLSSCVVERPSHSGISTYHKENNIKSVESPNYKKKLSMSGITFQIGATAGGAVAGMALSPTTFYGSDNKSTTNVVLNGVIGGAIGYGITSLMYVIQGQGKKRSMQPNKFPQWLDEYNHRHIGKEYVFTGFTNYSGYLVLPNNSKTENNYTASNVEQAIMFKNAFPYSSRNTAFETQAANRIYTQSDAALFLEYYPNSIYTNSVRQKLQKMEADIAARENARKQAQIEKNTNSALGIIGGVIIGGFLIKKGLEALASSSGGGSYDDNTTSTSALGYTILSKSEDTEVRVDYQPYSSTNEASVWVISEDNECDDYISIFQSNAKHLGKEKTYKGQEGARDDNNNNHGFECYASIDEPIIVTVSYTRDKGGNLLESGCNEHSDKISATIKITKPGLHYTITVLPR